MPVEKIKHYCGLHGAEMALLYSGCGLKELYVCPVCIKPAGVSRVPLPPSEQAYDAFANVHERQSDAAGNPDGGK